TIAAGTLEAQPAKPLRFCCEHLLEGSHPAVFLFPRHRGPAHNGRTGNCHPGLTLPQPAERSGRMQLPFVRRGADRTAEQQKSEAKQGPWSTARFILTLVILAWAFRSFIVAPFSIPSGSMLPTLYIGDYLVVAKWPYGYSRFSFPFGFPPLGGQILAHSPKRGDIVVFRHPNENVDLVKRV